MANKTLALLIGLLMLASTARASMMLEQWFDVFENKDFNTFLKAMIWQLWSTLGPFLSGLLRVVAWEQFLAFDDDVKYGMATAGMANFEDFFAYLMNNALDVYVFDNLGVSYTDEEFFEFDMDQFSIVE